MSPRITTTHQISHDTPRVHVEVDGGYVGQIAKRARVSPDRALSVVSAAVRSLPPGTYKLKEIGRPVDTNGSGYAQKGDTTFMVNLDLGQWEGALTFYGRENDGGGCC